MTHSAEIVEIFSSIQGEGPYAGQEMTFVRFGLCTMRCKFCDTPQGLCHQEVCHVESRNNTCAQIELPNPVSTTVLCETLENFDNEILSITGGEPLEQVSFLEEWLPTQFLKNKILLETNGVHHDALLRILPFVHIVSMDFKLPSACGVKPHWNDHVLFLQNAIGGGKETYVKIVVTSDTTDQDIQKAIDILTHANKYIPVVLQPASSTLTFHKPISDERLGSMERLCQAYLNNVRVIPQMHKDWGVR